MRCASCDKALSDLDSSRKGLFSGDYLDLCGGCLSTIPDLLYEENASLSNKRPPDEFEYEDELDNDEQEF